MKTGETKIILPKRRENVLNFVEKRRELREAEV
jgi:hypothetical protein